MDGHYSHLIKPRSRYFVQYLHFIDSNEFFKKVNEIYIGCRVSYFAKEERRCISSYLIFHERIQIAYNSVTYEMLYHERVIFFIVQIEMKNYQMDVDL